MTGYREVSHWELYITSNKASPLCPLPQMNTGVDYVNATYQPVIVYARVTQGSNPVVGAKVR